MFFCCLLSHNNKVVGSKYSLFQITIHLTFFISNLITHLSKKYYKNITFLQLALPVKSFKNMT
jgi:hypothetical protein